MSLLAVFTWGQAILGLGMILVCALLILVVLVQQASGGGLVGAFGGGGGGGGAFGAKTGDVFTVITCALAGLFLLMSITGNYIFKPVSVEVPVAVVSPPAAPISAFPTSSPDSVPVTPPVSGATDSPADTTPSPATTSGAQPAGGTAEPPVSGDGP